MEARVPRDNVQRHEANGKVVLYTVSFAPSEWEEILEGEDGGRSKASERYT